ncbi:hypothetical protein FRACYDRAFT_237373 [Fragilariopsis cylindrus CCMP1102]|uniref:C2H2-type domain-containing protein n=1 Tax=Fragilariopsis cylindrus CCMP1102 TaxID=635003 RepID=A0A1E7FLP2_9STRA|nr:hypothetical protein FRACYDRAFT_237373 [Fragilariopsis cylindrus CCMP1102]|eukprot:OEU19080.1 hypothetical protein FRACYDRAFT_237373 [Fragilariopsis cylindrus CCMP1102]
MNKKHKGSDQTSSFKCICAVVFTSIRNFRSHVCRCKTAEQSHHVFSEIKKHKQSHDQAKHLMVRIPCPIPRCTVTFDTKKSVIRHWNRSHKVDNNNMTYPEAIEHFKSVKLKAPPKTTLRLANMKRNDERFVLLGLAPFGSSEKKKKKKKKTAEPNVRSFHTAMMVTTTKKQQQQQQQGQPVWYGGQPVVDRLPHDQSITKTPHFKMSERRFHFKQAVGTIRFHCGLSIM